MIARGTAGGREPVGLFLAVEKGKQKQKHNVRTFRFIPPDTRYIRADTCAGRSVLFLGGDVALVDKYRHIRILGPGTSFIFLEQFHQ